MKNIVVLMLIVGNCLSGTVYAAPRESGGGKAVAKLQAMVRDITSERDALKTERDTLKTESEKLTADLAKLKKEKTEAESSAASVENRLSNELTAQKTNNEAITDRLEKTNAKLLEVIEKYKALNQEKNTLSVNHASLEDVQRQTKTELQLCEENNIKMFKAGKEVLERYENKSVFDTVLSSEPALQIKGVEMETLIQGYEDKLRKEKYQHKEITVTNAKASEPNTAPETESVQGARKP
jgi:chromosome segregation ATPase